MHLRRRIALLALALPLLALPTVGTHATAGGRQPPAATQEDLGAAASLVDATGAARWSDAYAGVALDVPAGVLIVHRIPTSRLDAELSALVPVPVRFVDAMHPARTLDAWQAQVFGDRDRWEARGVLIHSIWVDFGQCVILEIGDPQRDAARLTAAYPDMTLCVRQGWPPEPPLAIS
ncbi:hypothetical protein [Micromonospora sp. SH-82]|uniref:hypothetical protein n=1 Tax=Micromonospora sp. SH-82 TaxID=3132938 RepID=UPI003EB8179E